MTDMALIIIGALCLAGGWAGCLLPAIPGPPLAYAGLLALHLTRRVQFSNSLLVSGLVLVLVALVLDTVIPAAGAKRWGGSRWGIWGCAIGTLVGLLFVPPLGLVGGAFCGAVAGELLGGKQSGAALKAGFGALLGFLCGTVLKMAVCGLFAFWFVRALAK